MFLKIRRTFNLFSVSSLSLEHMLYEGIQHSSCPLSIIPHQQKGSGSCPKEYVNDSNVLYYD